MFSTSKAVRSLAVGVLIAWLSFFGVRSVLRHVDKHTGPCTVVYRDMTQKCYYFVRPNNEIFVTCFDNPPEFSRNMELADVVYRDDNEDFKHFVKAKFGKVQ